MPGFLISPDAATGEHGDLLDLIRESCGLVDFTDIVNEARAFLRMQPYEPEPQSRQRLARMPTGSLEAARRLLGRSKPILGTIVEAYLRERGIAHLQETERQRSHPRCYYRPDKHSPPEAWPAMIAAVTDLNGQITGAHRTWLDPSGRGKAPIDTPRRAMGALLGNAVRLGIGDDVMAAGEGIETVLSLRSVLLDMPMLAALSAAHLAAVLFPPRLRRLYIARDNDPAGDWACNTLTARARTAGIDTIMLSPQRSDFNDDLRNLGLEALRTAIRMQVAPDDVGRLMSNAA